MLATHPVRRSDGLEGEAFYNHGDNQATRHSTWTPAAGAGMAFERALLWQDFATGHLAADFDGSGFFDFLAFQNGFAAGVRSRFPAEQRPVPPAPCEHWSPGRVRRSFHLASCSPTLPAREPPAHGRDTHARTRREEDQ